MITTTTTTRSHRGRRVAAAALVGVGLVSLGVASASHLSVEAEGDLVASGVDAEIEGFLGPDASAQVNVTYADVNDGTAGTTLGTATTLPPTVALEVDPGATGALVAGDTVQVFFYSGENSDLVMEATIELTAAQATDVVGATGLDIYPDLTHTDDAVAPDALPHYDRVAVVAVSGDYGN